MAFRWILIVTISVFAVQGVLIPRQRNSADDNKVRRSFSDPGWIDQLSPDGEDCTVAVCESSDTFSTESCVVRCLLDKLQKLGLPTVERHLPDRPKDTQTFNNLLLCISNQCIDVSDTPQGSSTLFGCALEKCRDEVLADVDVFPDDRMWYESDVLGKFLGDKTQGPTARRDHAARRPKSVPGFNTKPGGHQPSKKRSYTDSTDICISYHCGNQQRGTFAFIKCVNDNRCYGR